MGVGHRVYTKTIAMSNQPRTPELSPVQPQRQGERRGRGRYESTLGHTPATEIANGENSTLWRAHLPDKNTGKKRELVIKRVPLNNESEESVCYELSVLYALKGTPGILEIIEHWLNDGYVYLLLEPCDKDLLDYLSTLPVHMRSESEGCCMKEDEAQVLFSQVARALRRAHEKQAFHGDIKPENCLLKFDKDNGDIAVRLGDFSKIPTQKCAAPEVIAGTIPRETNAWKAADIWALGCLLYNVVCGTELFGSRGILDSPRLGGWQKGEYQLNAALSNELKDLLCGMLAYNPEDRLSICEICDHSWLQNIDRRHDREAAAQRELESAVTDVVQKVKRRRVV